MNVKSAEQANGNAKVIVEIEKQEFEAALNKAYNKCRKDILVPGFRKGKAPRKIVEGMYGARVFYEDAINEIFPEIYNTAVTEQKLQAVGSPSVSNLDVDAAGNVILTVDVTLYPEVTLGDYKGLEVPKPNVNVTDEDVESEVDRMADRNSRIEAVERPAQEGDTVVLDYEGFDNGVAFEGGKADNYRLKIGSHSFVPGFEEALVGLSAGDEKEIDVTFPEDYTPDLAGKPVVFKCKIHEVKETITPAKDDEFAKDVSEFDTLEELRTDIRTRLTKERQEAADREFENAAVELAASNMTCNIPACMVDEHVNKQLEQFSYQLQMNGSSLENYVKMMGSDLNGLRNALRPMAEKAVRAEALLKAVAEAEKLDVSEDETETEYQNLAEQSQMDVEKVKDAVFADDLKADLLSKKARKLIVDHAVAIDTAKKEEAESPAAEE